MLLIENPNFTLASDRRLVKAKFMFIVSMTPSSHLILRCPLLLLPSTFPSIRVFPNESTVHTRWPKHWII